MKKMVIKLDDDGFVYRGTKLIAVVNDGDIMFKHYSYKKHLEEIEFLLHGDDNEPIADIGLEPMNPKPKTPAHLLLEGEGRWYGESNPPVVLRALKRLSMLIKVKGVKVMIVTPHWESLSHYWLINLKQRTHLSLSLQQLLHQSL